MKRRLPPLKAVRVFEAAAEHESFVAAAAELGVTKGAVSQQIRALEDYLHQRLFQRAGRGVRLTEAGRQYQAAVGNALTILERATERFRPPTSRATIKLTVLPAFAAMWLVPRLADFQARHPGIDIQLSADPELVDFSRSDAHVGIRYGTGGTVAGEVRSLGYDTLFPACSVAYADRLGIRAPADLARWRLRHATYWQNDWRRWAAAAGVEPPNLAAGQYFTHTSMAVDAARAGAGVLLAHERLVAEALAGGELVRLFDDTVPSEQEYFVVTPRRAAHLAAVKAFVAWLCQAAAD